MYKIFVLLLKQPLYIFLIRTTEYTFNLQIVTTLLVILTNPHRLTTKIIF